MRMAVWLGAAAACVIGAAGSAAGSTEPAPPRQSLVAALHVHSTVSTGSLTLDELAERAERMGIDALILSENFVLRYEYGVPPLRGVFRWSLSLPSVAQHGIGRFLTEIEEVQSRHPRVLLVPGVEVAPHYYWTGSLLDRNLTMHNAQRNLLVFGLTREEDYRTLPAVGNDGASQFGLAAAANMLPVLLLAPAWWLWRRRSHRTVRVGVVLHRVERRHRMPAAGLAVAAVALSVNAWPFATPVFSQYDAGLGDRPYQAVIDLVSARGGAAVWSMPEARDVSVHSFGPLGTVTVRTDPYADVLPRTTGYAGFGGVYQDTRTAAEPEGIWDRMLTDYLTARRATPPFVYGEIAFHTPGEAGIELNQVLNVLRVRERSVAGVVEAMRTGRVYAVAEPNRVLGWRLERFDVGTDGGERTAAAGDVFTRNGAEDVTIRVEVSGSAAGQQPVTLVVVRAGQVIARTTGTLPLTQRFVDRTLPAGQGAYYRVEVHGEGEILSNPIVVKPGSPA